MVVYNQIVSLQKAIANIKSNGSSIGFVPTMGSLHEGHLFLVRQARQENNHVIVSIFVNPTQFNNPEDLRNYPRNLEQDLRLLEPLDVDIVFAPADTEMYPSGAKEPLPSLSLSILDTVMEGKQRPGHFKGVVQVVSKLFSIVQPDAAYFGEKDFQQLAVIRFMTQSLRLPVRIVGCPTVREPDGLAMSSRNVLLAPDARTEAARISKALFFVRDHWKEFSVEEICSKARDMLEEHGMMRVEYVTVANADTLEPVLRWTDYPSLRCCAAVNLGKVRLIDNVGINTTVS